MALSTQLAITQAYFLMVLLAAQHQRRKLIGDPKPSAADATTRFVVLMPAHNEEHGISTAIASLQSTQYPTDLLRIVAIADNCADNTAVTARASGAEVWERDDPARRAKGFALSWALERLMSDEHAFDAVAIIDADCSVSSNFFTAMDLRVRGDSQALQSNYIVSNPDGGDAAALRFAAFSLINTVRPMGKQSLGLSCGLLGTGMVFTPTLLSRVPWRESGLAEDDEYHLRLVAAGERVEFLAEASVISAMPTSFDASEQQQARWEQGKLHLIKSTPNLLRSGVSMRDPVRVHSALEILVPPQSLLAVGSLSCLVGGLLVRSRRLTFINAITLMAQASFVLLGLRFVGAPLRVYRSLCLTPTLVMRKLLLYTRLLAGRGPQSWVRTARGEHTENATR